MSYEAIDQVFALRGLTPTQRVVLLVIANFADKSGMAFPSIRKISELIEVSEATVRRVLIFSVARGILKKEAWFSESGRQTSNRYHIIFEQAEISKKLKRASIATKGGGGQSTGGGGGRRAEAPLEPSVDSSVDPSSAGQQESEVVRAFVALLEKGHTIRNPMGLAGKVLLRHVRAEEAELWVTEAKKLLDVNVKSKAKREHKRSLLVERLRHEWAKLHDPGLSAEVRLGAWHSVQEIRKELDAMSGQADESRN